MVSDMCLVYLTKKMSDQWKQIIQTIGIGKAILSNNDSPSLLYYNPALKEFMEKLYPETHRDNEMERLINELNVRIVTNGSDNDEIIGKLKLKELIINFDNKLSKSQSFFLDEVDSIIQIKVSDAVFDEKKAKIISFTDCSAVQKLKQIQTECKYKTILISTISHELRTPVNAILGTLELVSEFIPEHSRKLLDMSKECCNMITSQINDLTVILL